jgi:hypothetical protein
MKVNGRAMESVNRNIGFCDAKLAVNRERLLIALARRNESKVKKLSAEVRRVSEVRERWLAEGLEVQFPGLNGLAGA